jgi:hypothetical protein
MVRTIRKNNLHKALGLIFSTTKAKLKNVNKQKKIED